jgi:hypothetical protein
MDHNMKEVIKTDFHANSINRVKDLLFSRSWKSLIHLLRERRRRVLQGEQFFTGPFGHNIYVLH